MDAETRQQELERERRRLAQRLDQDIASSLALLQAQTDTYLNVLRGNSQAVQALSVIRSLVSQSLQRTRYLQHHLHPSVLETLGLEAALESLASDEQRVRGLHIALRLLRLRDRLPAALEVVLFRSIQHWIEQAVEEASASEFGIALQKEGALIRLHCQDNGRWDNQALLRVLHRDVQRVGGSVQHTPAEQGLHFVVHVPLQEHVMLTPREREIMQLVAEGLTNKQIARRLHLSARTVNFHLDNVYSKLGVNSRTEAALIAIQQRWIDNPQA